jgi:hypothetical protein
MAEAQGGESVSKLEDHQWGKAPDVWSQALWLGAALNALKLVAATPGLGDENFNTDSARYWMACLPNEIKATRPGIFPEFPYLGEPESERAEREAWDRQAGAKR